MAARKAAAAKAAAARAAAKAPAVKLTGAEAANELTSTILERAAQAQAEAERSAGEVTTDSKSARRRDAQHLSGWHLKFVSIAEARQDAVGVMPEPVYRWLASVMDHDVHAAGLAALDKAPAKVRQLLLCASLALGHGGLCVGEGYTMLRSPGASLWEMRAAFALDTRAMLLPDVVASAPGLAFTTHVVELLWWSVLSAQPERRALRSLRSVIDRAVRSSRNHVGVFPPQLFAPLPLYSSAGQQPAVQFDPAAVATRLPTQWTDALRSPRALLQRSPAWRIPRLLHFVWMGGSGVPEDKVRSLRQWLELHPEWRARLWTDADLPDLVLGARVNSSRSHVQQADLVRYEAVHRHGGVYVDLDFDCLRAIDPVAQSAHGFVCHDNDVAQMATSLSNGLFGFAKGHPAMARAMALARHALLNTRDVQHKTGARFFRRAVGQGIGELLVLPADAFYPVSFGNRHKLKGLTCRGRACAAQFPRSYAMHRWASEEHDNLFQPPPQLREDGGCGSETGEEPTAGAGVPVSRVVELVRGHNRNVKAALAKGRLGVGAGSDGAARAPVRSVLEGTLQDLVAHRAAAGTSAMERSKTPARERAQYLQERRERVGAREVTTLTDDCRGLDGTTWRSRARLFGVDSQNRNLMRGDRQRLCRKRQGDAGGDWLVWELEEAAAIAIRSFHWPNEPLRELRVSVAASIRDEFADVEPHAVRYVVSDGGQKWLELKSEWKLPPGSNLVKVHFPPNSKRSPWSPQLGHVVLSTHRDGGVMAALPSEIKRVRM